MYYLDKSGSPFYKPTEKVIKDSELTPCDEAHFNSAVDLINNPELTTEQKIEQLESEQTARMLRQAALGDTESIAMLQAIEDQIAELRLEL